MALFKRKTEFSYRTRTIGFTLLASTFLSTAVLAAEGDLTGDATSSLEPFTLSSFHNGMIQSESGEYEKAIKTFYQLIQDHPDHPIGYFGTAAVYQAIMRNYRTSMFEIQFRDLLNHTIQVSKSNLRKNPHDAYTHFFLGAAYGFRGEHKSRKNNWIGAFKDALKCVSGLKRVLEINPQFYDAYYAIGVYHYWSSAKSILSVFGDKREEGIEQVWTAVRSGTCSTIFGRLSLVKIYYNEKEYQKAWPINSDLLKQFPDSPSIRYMQIRLCERLKNWEEVEHQTGLLLDHLQQSNYQNTGFVLECHYRIAQAQYHLDKHHEARVHLEKALALREQRDLMNELDGLFEKFETIVQETESLYQTITQASGQS